MLIDLIATVTAGFAGAGIALILRHLTGGRVPRGFAPVAAGLAMMGFLVWNDYNWFERTVDGLDERVEVVSSYPVSALWRPWTYVVPVTERFMAYDTASIHRHEAQPDQAVVNLLLFARRTPPATVPVLIDCAGQRRADIHAGFEFEPDGSVSGVTWHDMAADDPLPAALCPLA